MSATKIFDFEEVIGSALKADNSIPLEFYQARDGAQLPFRRYTADSRVHTILIHGSSAHSNYLCSLGEYLSSNDITHVYTPDLRGHGPETKTRGDVSYIDQLEDDIADLITFIQAEAESDIKIIVGGHSSGGSMALRFAESQYGSSVAGTLLLAPYLGSDSPAVRKNAGGWAKPAIPKIIVLSILNRMGIRIFNSTKVLRFNKPEQYITDNETLEYSYNLLTAMHPENFGVSLGNIQTPLIAMIGEDDEIFYPNLFEENIKPYKNDAQIVFIEGAKHLGIVTNKTVMTEAANWIRSIT